MNKIVDFPVEITDKECVRYLHKEYKDVHSEMLKGASIKCLFKGKEVILDKKNRNNLDVKYATKTKIQHDKLKTVRDIPTAYMFHQYGGDIIPLWEIKLED